MQFIKYDFSLFFFENWAFAHSVLQTNPICYDLQNLQQQLDLTE